MRCCPMADSQLHVSRQKFLCIEIFRTIMKLSPSFMQQIFKVKSSSLVHMVVCFILLIERNQQFIELIKILLDEIASDL